MSETSEVEAPAPADSFWEVGQFKRTVSRIENGEKQFAEMTKFLQERALIEEMYCNKLKEWSMKWGRQLERSTEYNTALNGWKATLKEADQVGNYHLSIKDQLHVEMENIKNWKKQNYHKQMLGGLKEAKELDKDFEKAQKPWAKLLKKVNEAKKNYYSACRDERLAQAQENAAKSTEKPEKVKSLQEIVEKRGIDREMAKSKYEQALTDIQYNSVYKDSMKAVFHKSQEIEKHRQEFVKTIWTSYHKSIDTGDSSKLKSIYKTLKQSITSIDSESDLAYWEEWHGPGMAMDWPAFQEYDPEAKKTKPKAPRNIAPSEVYRLKNGEMTRDGGEISVTTMGSASAGDWSDEDDEGVAVKALYDYKGQEEDEISFQAGDTLWKLTEEDEQGWSKGRLTNGTVGLYPANYVQPI